MTGCSFVSSPKTIAGITSAVILFVAVVATTICCFLCSCCYLYRRRQQLQSPFEGRRCSAGAGAPRRSPAYLHVCLCMQACAYVCLEKVLMMNAQIHWFSGLCVAHCPTWCLETEPHIRASLGQCQACLHATIQLCLKPSVPALLVLAGGRWEAPGGEGVSTSRREALYFRALRHVYLSVSKHSHLC